MTSLEQLFNQWAEYKRRRETIIKYHRDNPELTQDEVASHFGITKQRVSQIFQKEGEAW